MNILNKELLNIKILQSPVIQSSPCVKLQYYFRLPSSENKMFLKEIKKLK